MCKIENFPLFNGGVFIKIIFQKSKSPLFKGGGLLKGGFLLGDPVYRIFYIASV